MYFVLKDHLGSASVVTDSTGTTVGEDRFYPFGETRFTTGSMFTDKLFTGQREITGLGIYHFGARFYSPKLGRFLSADSIVPGYTDPQNLNRFSYVKNNPLRYIDPTGHKCVSTGPGDCLNDNLKPINGAGGLTLPKKKPGNNNNNGGGWVDNYCNTHPGACGTPAPIVTPTPTPTPIVTPDTPTGTPLVVTGTSDLRVTLPAQQCIDRSCAGSVPNGMTYHQNNTLLSSIFLYRAVSTGELNDVMENQLFRPNPNGLSNDVKWFWETLHGAQGWQQQYNLDAIVKVTAPDEVMEFTSSTSENMDNLGPAVSFIDEGLDAFNELLTEIEILGEDVAPLIP